MLTRLSAGFVLIVALALVAFATIALWHAHEMAQALGAAASVHGELFDPGDWARRWRLSSILLLSFGVLGTLAGYGLMRGRRWGLTVWCGAVTGVLVDALATGVFARYEFERLHMAEGVVVGAVCLMSWLAWWVSRNR
jgi:hypothetical protein